MKVTLLHSDIFTIINQNQHFFLQSKTFPQITWMIQYEYTLAMEMIQIQHHHHLQYAAERFALQLIFRNLWEEKVQFEWKCYTLNTASNVLQKPLRSGGLVVQWWNGKLEYGRTIRNNNFICHLIQLKAQQLENQNWKVCRRYPIHTYKTYDVQWIVGKMKKQNHFNRKIVFKSKLWPIAKHK